MGKVSARFLHRRTGFLGIAATMIAASLLGLSSPAFGDVILEDGFSEVQGENGFFYGTLIGGTMNSLAWSGSRWDYGTKLPYIWEDSGIIKMQSKINEARWSVYSWQVPETGDYDFQVTFSSQELTPNADVRNNVYVYTGEDPLNPANQLFVGEIRHQVSGYSVLYDTLGSPVVLTAGTEVRFAVGTAARKIVGLTGTVSHAPIPATAWLLGFGLIGLVGFRRKTKED